MKNNIWLVKEMAASTPTVAGDVPYAPLPASVSAGNSFIFNKALKTSADGQTEVSRACLLPWQLHLCYYLTCASQLQGTYVQIGIFVPVRFPVSLETYLRQAKVSVNSYVWSVIVLLQ